ncbi:MAG: hypothetical protein JWM51_590, partial [Microbacteriaceae bacterium]|nr:hypothetical protein [Microbacteriaceae bacterium]
MKLKLTLQRASGPVADIVVTTDAAATVGDVAGAIATVDPFVAKLGGARSGDLTIQIVDPAGLGHKLLEPELALGEAALGSGATIALVPSDRVTPAVVSEVVAVLHVIEGPDTGAHFDLATGTRYLGRDAASSDIVLSDPLVSKRHARLDVFAQSVRMVDLNSANGLEVDGGPVTRVDLGDGDVVRIGDSVMRAEIAPPTGVVVQVESGPVAFNRSPRVETRYPGTEYAAPKMPTEKDVQPFPWVVMIAPVLLGGVFFFTGRPLDSLIFLAASPFIMLGTYLSTRATKKKKEKLEIKRFEERATMLEERLEAEIAVERNVRLREAPSTVEVYDEAMRLGPLLWTRRPEHWQFLSLNLGIGTMQSRNAVSMSNEDAALPQFLERVLKTQDRFRDITDVPVTENLFFSGALGVAGVHSASADMARGIIVQATGLHSPAELVVAAIVSNAWTAEVEWLKWLPHTGSPHSPLEVGHLANSQATGDALLSAIEDLIAKRTKAVIAERGASMLEKSALIAGATVGDGAETATAPSSATPAVLLVISNDAPVDRARLVQVAERGADAGVYPVWVSPTVAELPAVTRTFVEASRDGHTAEVGLVRLGNDITAVRTEPITRQQALGFARRLAPVVDGGALQRDASDLPRTVSMLSLL